MQTGFFACWLLQSHLLFHINKPVTYSVVPRAASSLGRKIFGWEGGGDNRHSCPRISYPGSQCQGHVKVYWDGCLISAVASLVSLGPFFWLICLALETVYLLAIQLAHVLHALVWNTGVVEDV